MEQMLVIGIKRFPESTEKVEGGGLRKTTFTAENQKVGLQLKGDEKKKKAADLGLVYEFNS